MRRCTRVAAVAFLWFCGCAGAEALSRAQVRNHNGRPTLFVNDRPNALTTYCPIGWNRRHFVGQAPRFYPHKMDAYTVMLPVRHVDLHGTQFWDGGGVSGTPLFSEPEIKMQGFNCIDESALHILEGDPNTHLIVRMSIDVPKSWREVHAQEYFLTEEGERGSAPSMASDLYWDTAARYCKAIVRYCESRSWSGRIVGYQNMYLSEGTHPAVIDGWLFDHNPAMLERWRAFLKTRYGTDARLREAYGDDTLALETASVPRDRLRGPAPEVSRLAYWQAAEQNRALRDYLELQTELFHERFRQITAAMRAGTDRERFFVYDAFKQTMQGWNCGDFFTVSESRRVPTPDLLGGSGSMRVVRLFDAAGFDGVITPHCYQHRGIGGVFEPEGIADSIVLRGKLFFCEMDMRTYVDSSAVYGAARNYREYEAISWRNIATALTRGFSVYWMDLYSDWYAPPEIQSLTARQVAVLKESLDWRHATVPGIAMIVDDTALFETGGAGNVMNESVMWEQKLGLARCGVPFRIYLLDDLLLPNFPEHRVFYFPNLYRVDEGRLELLRDKVFRNGHVVVWGPGSGISDGHALGAQSAERLTGFGFHVWPVNYSRRVQITNFEHPVTRNLPADCSFGGPLSYGPLLFPTNGVSLGNALTKNGHLFSGLALRKSGQGVQGRDAGDYESVFTTAVPLPADLWRELARHAGAHVYSADNDVLLAGGAIVAVHSVKSGRKRIRLPGPHRVYDVVSGALRSRKTDTLDFDLEAPATHVFRLEAR